MPLITVSTASMLAVSWNQLLDALGTALHFLRQLADHLDGRFHHVGTLARLPAGVIGHLRGALGVARHLMDGTAHLRRGGADLVHRRVLAVDQTIVGGGHAGQRTGGIGDLAGDPADLADQRLQLVEEGVEGAAEAAGFVARSDLQTHAQVTIAVGDLFQALQQALQRTGHQAGEHQYQRQAHQQAERHQRHLLPAVALAQRGGRLAVGGRGRLFHLIELVDHLAHRPELAIAVTVAELRRGARIAGRQAQHPRRGRAPEGIAALELGDLGQFRLARLHRRVLAHPIQGLLQVFRVIVPQAGDLLGVQEAIEQAALGDEGLVEIAVGVEQQGDAGEKTLAQALVDSFCWAMPCTPSAPTSSRSTASRRIGRAIFLRNDRLANHCSMPASSLVAFQAIGRSTTDLERPYVRASRNQTSRRRVSNRRRSSFFAERAWRRITCSRHSTKHCAGLLRAPPRRVMMPSRRGSKVSRSASGTTRPSNGGRRR